MEQRTLFLAVACLGLCAFTASVGLVVLSILQEPIPPALAAVLGTCLGALGGLLTQPPNGRKPPWP
jgi:hypothetical protein